MSREFGDYTGSMFFHEHVYAAIQDLKTADFSLHKEFLPLLENLYDVAYAISSVEAGDSGEYRSIMETISKLDAMYKNLDQIKDAVDPYKQVMEEALRDK